MARDNGPGIFTMDVISKISKITDLLVAKVTAEEAVQHSTANDANKTKAMAMIRSANTVQKLMLGMSNFMLSHMGMKTT